MKRYIEPSIDVIEMDIDVDMLTGSDELKFAREVGTDQFSKERQAVDFSDSESIW